MSGYQWFQNGTALSGQTTATLNLTNVQVANAGDYAVVVTNACISLTSTAFGLSVNVSGIIHVTESGSGLQNGSGWANAMPGTALQQAIDAAAVCGGQVWVAAGTYKPTNTVDRTISFSMRNNVAIYGGFVGSETALSGRPAVNPVTEQPSSSTLSGEIGDPTSLTDNSQGIVYHPEGLSLNSSAVLDGFVLTRGNGNAGGECGTSVATAQRCGIVCSFRILAGLCIIWAAALPSRIDHFIATQSSSAVGVVSGMITAATPP